jgi:tRNA-dihydrouridine synthase C
LGNRIKQWLAYLRLTYAEADDLFHAIKREKDAAVFEQALLTEVAA